MRRLFKVFLGLLVLAYVVVQLWFIWPEYGHKIIYKFTTSPEKVLRKDIVLHRDELYAGIDKHGHLNYFSDGAWINTISSLDAPYVSLNNPLAEKKPEFENVVYNKPHIFKAGEDITAVSFSGYVKKEPYIHVHTTYSVFDPDTLMISTSIVSSKSREIIWTGDKIKTNSHSIWFYVPGVGDITTGPRDGISPQKPYLAILGRANQAIGFYYLDQIKPVYIFYQWNWLASAYQIRLDTNKPFTFTRVLSAKSTTGMDYKKIADTQYKNFIAIQNGVKITASSYNIITHYNTDVKYTVYVTNISREPERITGGTVFAPEYIKINMAYNPTVYNLYPKQTYAFTYTVKPLAGGDFYIYPALVINRMYIEGPWTHIFSNGPGWYSADMHNHSVYSFNPEDYPVRDMTEAAQAKGLDILSLTDYNTFSQADACRAQSTAEFLCIPGEEIANPIWGHANAQFIHKKVYEFLSPQHWIDDVHAQGGMFFVNHPYLEMREWRDWNFKGYDGIEVLNGNKIPMDPVNVKAFDKWDELNRSGLHLYGIADSDAHTPYAVGTYRNYVYATSFTIAAIEAGFKKGMFYVTNGPMLSFTIDNKPIGSTINIKKGQSINIKAAYLPRAQSPEDASPIQKIILFKDGYILTTTDTTTLDYTDTPEASGFYRVEVFTNNGGFAASNPIWVRVL
ncbi:MAG: CehA/McbA family metallohydrolase [bacterium]